MNTSPAVDKGRMRGFVAAVVACGVALAALTTLIDGHEDVVGDRRWELLLLVSLLCICELRPISVARAGGVDQIVASTTFAFAIFLAYGPLTAMAAQATASIISDLAERKPASKVCFNIGQYLVSWGLAGLAYRAIAGDVDVLGQVEGLGWRWALAATAAALVYFLVNSAMVGAVVAVRARASMAAMIWSSARQEVTANLVLLALAPVVVVVADRSLWLVPLLLLPVIEVYRSAASSAARDHEARHDALTGLPNRTNLLGQLAHRLERPGAAAVLLIDLDHFKEVNDTLGHQAGDALLREIGPRLARVLPDHSSIARLGGDEFAVLLPNVASDAMALAIAREIRAALEAPFVVSAFDVELALGASIGIALFPAHGSSTDVLLQRADIAMYVAKGSSAGIELYDPVQDHHSTRRLALMGQLRAALADGQILLHYQPKLDLRSGAVVEVEALVRWLHPDLGLIPPIEFIGMAERTGLIRPLTSHVLELAAAQVRSWHLSGIAMSVAVNLSTRSLHDASIADEVDACLARHQLPASALRLELTESAIMEDPDRSRLVLERLSAAGLEMSIDDYGTGYSSLAYLQELPVREIKIDRSFVTDLATNDADRVIVRSTIDLAHNLGLTATAEGVETDEALAWLVSAGCDHAQGYLIARPMPAGDVPAWLRARDGSPPAGGQRNQAGRRAS